MTKVAFLGLGHMGAPMARNLARAGFELTVWNRTPKPASEVPGARVAGSVSEAVREAEFAVTMLSDDRAVEAVVFGDGGLLGALPRGAIHVGCSTIGVALAERLVKAHAAAGQRFVGAPVFGRPDAAERRQLWIVPGGAEADVAACAELFAALGRGTFPMPTAPQAALAKILGNFMIAATVESLAETMALAERAGLEPERLLAMLTGTLFGSPVVERYGALIARTEFRPAGFAMPLGLKDVGLAMDAGQMHRVPLPLASLLRDHYLEALAKGREDWDWSGVASVVREAAGLPPERASATPSAATPSATPSAATPSATPAARKP